MAEYTRFGLAVKTKLLGPPVRTQTWLAEEVRATTGLYVDDAYISKILTGQRSAPKITQAIRDTAAAWAASALSGKSLSQTKKAAEALNEETEALEGVGSAADSAKGNMASFDEINVLSTGTGPAVTAPSFDFETEGAEDNFDTLLNIVKAIGTAFLTWKVSGSMKELFSKNGLKNLVGAFIAVDGAIGLARSTWDAWQNGLDQEGLFAMLGRSAELILGLFILLGKTGGAIGLIGTGLVMLATAFHDAAANGWNLQNLLLAVMGILAAGAGIALFAGSWIPLLVAGIAAALLALTVATGHGGELIEGVKTILGGFLDFFTGIFTGDIEKAVGGIGKIFDGLGVVVGAVIGGVKDTFLGFLDWLDEKTGGRFRGIIQFAKGLITGFFGVIEVTASDFIEALKMIFTGLLQFITGVFTGDWDMAWEGIKNIFKGAWNGVVTLLEGAINLMVKALNWLIGQMNKIKFDVPDWVPGIGGKSIGINIPSIAEASIPRLATGAVIPPNREFLAVLGDQRSGTNIEAPLSTIEQAVENVLNRRGTGGGMTLTVKPAPGLTRYLKYELDAETTRRGGKLTQGGTA